MEVPRRFPGCDRNYGGISIFGNGFGNYSNHIVLTAYRREIGEGGTGEASM